MKDLTPVSIIIPTLNEEDYIGNLLASLVAQTHQNMEVIIVDGDSKDNTIKVCERFKSIIPCLSILKSPVKSLPYQRNYGEKHAVNERILFLDADIILPSNFLSQSIAEIEKEKALLATCYSWPLSSKLLDYAMYLAQNVGADIAKHIVPAIFGWTIFSTKKLHKKIGGFNEKLKNFGEDQDYAHKAVRAKARFIILKDTAPYVSVRRLDYEGRFNMFKKGILYGILAAAYGKEEAQQFMHHEYGDYEKIKQGIKLSAKKYGLSKNTILELHNFFDPLVKYPLNGSRVVITGAKSVIGKLNSSLQKILES